jgi:hypothetical protein
MCSLLSDHTDDYDYLLLTNPLSLSVRKQTFRRLLAKFSKCLFIFTEVESFQNHFPPIKVLLSIVFFEEFKFIL